MSIQDLYENDIRPLPAMDRLRLASLILEDLAASRGEGLDLREDWSDDDLSEVTAFSLKRAADGEGADG